MKINEDRIHCDLITMRAFWFVAMMNFSDSNNSWGNGSENSEEIQECPSLFGKV